jgi:hypothetical protein
MARAVATLEGDSTSLVKAISDAKKEMIGLEGGGKALSKQLKDVAGEADKAAGALVNKIGGGTAIKAIAGVSAAFVGAERALGAFSSSMSAFASTQGAAGQKAMADLDTALNELQGQLFTAVMGTDDMDEAMKTLLGVVDFLTIAFQALLVPVSAFSGLVKSLTTDHSSAAVQAREHAKAESEYGIALAASNGQMKTAHEGYAGVERSIIGLLGTKREMAIFDLEETQRQYQMIILQQDRAMQARRMAAGDFEAAKAESAKKAELVDAEAAKIQATEDKLEAAGKEGRRGRSADQIREIAEARVTNDAKAAVLIDGARQQARQQSNARLTEQELGFKTERDRLIEAQKRLETLKTQLANAKDVTPRVTGGNTPAAVAPVAVEETSEAKMFREMGEYMEKGRKAQEEASAKAYADGIAAEVAKFRAGEAEKEAIRLAGIEKEKADDLAAFEFRKGLAEDLFQVKAKVLVKEAMAGKNAAKVAADMARKAIGDAISAKGDEAMAQAAIYAASFNPMAIPMAAAGVAAYAAAAALGSSAKKGSSATPASAAPAAQAGPVNTAFNLRVDAAFADGESIARQFAMMQRSAQRRGLVTAGA